MKYVNYAVLLALVLAAGSQIPVSAHCEVPCGIYGDSARFEALLEDHTTVAKAMDQILMLSAKADAQSHNQLARWVSNKESHATRIQHTIAQYFMAQRIKPADPAYVDKLTKAHAVMLAAMKCKQTVETSAADALKEAILAFHAAYQGKK